MTDVGYLEDHTTDRKWLQLGEQLFWDNPLAGLTIYMNKVSARTIKQVVRHYVTGILLFFEDYHTCTMYNMYIICSNVYTMMFRGRPYKHENWIKLVENDMVQCYKMQFF